jgi:hypothetical protein
MMRREQPRAALQLRMKPQHQPAPIRRVCQHGEQQVRQALVCAELEQPSVEENEAKVVARGLVDQTENQVVQEGRFATASAPSTTRCWSLPKSGIEGDP